MGMYISISDTAGWGTSFGVFDCIVEATRDKFSTEQTECVCRIYDALDAQGQSFVTLDKVDSNCFNLFYQYCEEAMNEFADSDRGRYVPESHVEGILWNWSEVLRIMREDSRYVA